MADLSAPRDQALEVHIREAATLRNGDSEISSPEIGDDQGAHPSTTAVTPKVGHRFARRAPRRVVRRIVPKSAATTGQQQRRSVLNDRRQATSSPSATGSDNAAALARQQKKATDAKARTAKAREALSPEYMRKAAAAMFENASVTQQNAAAPAAGVLEALEAARQRKKAADAKARATKARKALSSEYMRKAAAVMFEKASVAQQNATQATQMK
jgi:hypothetical protein